VGWHGRFQVCLIRHTLAVSEIKRFFYSLVVERGTKPAIIASAPEHLWRFVFDFFRSGETESFGFPYRRIERYPTLRLTHWAGKWLLPAGAGFGEGIVRAPGPHEGDGVGRLRGTAHALVSLGKHPGPLASPMLDPQAAQQTPSHRPDILVCSTRVQCRPWHHTSNREQFSRTWETDAHMTFALASEAPIAAAGSWQCGGDRFQWSGYRWITAFRRLCRRETHAMVLAH